MTFSLPDSLAQRFLASIPPRKRSAAIAKVLEKALAEQELEEACHAANADEALNEEIAEWHAFGNAMEA